MKRRTLPLFLRHPLLTFGVIVLPIMTSFLPSFTNDARHLVFGGFLSGCLMSVIIFKKR